MSAMEVSRNSLSVVVLVIAILLFLSSLANNMFLPALAGSVIDPDRCDYALPGGGPCTSQDTPSSDLRTIGGNYPGYYPPSNPYPTLQQLQQGFALVEQQLSQMSPQQQQAAISTLQQQVRQILSSLSPQEQQATLHILQQSMSPQLAGVLLQELSTKQPVYDAWGELINNCMAQGYSREQCEKVVIDSDPQNICDRIKNSMPPGMQINLPCEPR